MDPAYAAKEIVDLSDAELISLGFLGENVAPEVKDIVEKVKACPDYLGVVRFSRPAPSKAETLYSKLNNDVDSNTVVAPNLISEYEMNFWYHGISVDPPKLMWRSDLETNPFPIPPPGTPFLKIPTKAAHGVFKTPLNDVWDVVAPRILASIKSRGLRYYALSTVRFWTAEDGKDETRGPVVVWIAVDPNAADPKAVRDATPDILHILADVQITDVVVEWYEGSPVARLVDCRVPVIPCRQSDDVLGTLTLLFREMKISDLKSRGDGGIRSRVHVCDGPGRDTSGSLLTFMPPFHGNSSR
ncbi:hypothetical protein C8Q78DRAFT_1141073 [Trametes maxima]|nr:hypothetical protein C8Q78DRAFT_1141073 [Trametes maxima]